MSLSVCGRNFPFPAMFPVLLIRFDVETYLKWTEGVDEACSFNLAQPLLARNEETRLIRVNFDPKVRTRHHRVVFQCV